jgi:hypothetical protein
MQKLMWWRAERRWLSMLILAGSRGRRICRLSDDGYDARDDADRGRREALTFALNPDQTSARNRGPAPSGSSISVFRRLTSPL